MFHLPRNIKEILKSGCPFWQGRSVEETHMLVLISKTLQNQPLTLRRFINFLENFKSKEGRTAKIKYISETILKNYGDKPIESSFWLLVPKEILPETADKFYSEQKKTFANFIAPDYEELDLLEMTIAMVMYYFTTGTRLFQTTHVRCKQETVKGWKDTVGGFFAEGFSINSDRQESQGYIRGRRLKA